MRFGDSSFRLAKNQSNRDNKSTEDTKLNTEQDLILTELRTVLKNKRRVFRMKALSRIIKRREECKRLDLKEARNFFSHISKERGSSRTRRNQCRVRGVRR